MLSAYLENFVQKTQTVVFFMYASIFSEYSQNTAKKFLRILQRLLNTFRISQYTQKKEDADIRTCVKFVQIFS